jgi:hypothetical protein
MKTATYIIAVAFILLALGTLIKTGSLIAAIAILLAMILIWIVKNGK